MEHAAFPQLELDVATYAGGTGPGDVDGAARQEVLPAVGIGERDVRLANSEWSVTEIDNRGVRDQADLDRVVAGEHRPAA